MDVTTYDRETYENDYYDISPVKPENYSCLGCYLLDCGEGGENQLAHMDPAGCLYKDDDTEDTYVDCNTYTPESNEQNAPQKKTKLPKNLESKSESDSEKKMCIVCKEAIKGSENIKFCKECENKEDRLRNIRYDSFIADNYLNNL